MGLLHPLPSGCRPRRQRCRRQCRPRGAAGPLEESRGVSGKVVRSRMLQVNHWEGAAAVGASGRGCTRGREGTVHEARRWRGAAREAGRTRKLAVLALPSLQMQDSGAPGGREEAEQAACRRDAGGKTGGHILQHMPACDGLPHRPVAALEGFGLVQRVHYACSLWGTTARLKVWFEDRRGERGGVGRPLVSLPPCGRRGPAAGPHPSRPHPATPCVAPLPAGKKWCAVKTCSGACQVVGGRRADASAAEAAATMKS